MKYRREIDGLRAVAVVPVILFHAGLTVFSGGYVGVDVFFVISGYLITSIIIAEKEEGRFSLLNFYGRRARRILPALFLVALFCVPVAWQLLPPRDLKEFADSLVAMATFSTNILFWRESGYFATAAELKPLLHTWSLAVEEQFYILYPLFLLTMWRFGRRSIIWALIAIFVVSLGAAHWGAYHKPSATFYLLPTRAWELLVGAFAAFFLRKGMPATPLSVSNTLSALGLAAILYAVFAFDETTPFPSLYALVPTVGAVLIILFATRRTLVNSLLSLGPVVAVGMISYSLYLWHQPLLAFMKYMVVDQDNRAYLAIVLAATVALSLFSHAFVEKPFRKVSGPSAFNMRMFIGYGAVASAFLLVGVWGHARDGFPDRLAASGEPFSYYDRFLAINPGIGFNCIEQRDIQNVLDDPSCSTRENPRVLLWGDSYAMHIYGMMSQNAEIAARGIVQIALSQCAPNMRYGKNGSETSASECIGFNDQVLRLISEGSFDYVVMASPYAYLHTALYDREGAVHSLETPEQLADLLRETAEAVAKSGATPVFVEPPPANGQHLANCSIRILSRGLPENLCDYPVEDIETGRLGVYAALESLAGDFKVIDFRPVLCPDGVCKVTVNSVPLYRDNGHFSVQGSRLIGQLYDPFARIFAPR